MQSLSWPVIWHNKFETMVPASHHWICLVITLCFYGRAVGFSCRGHWFVIVSLSLSQRFCLVWFSGFYYIEFWLGFWFFFFIMLRFVLAIKEDSTKNWEIEDVIHDEVEKILSSFCNWSIIFAPTLVNRVVPKRAMWVVGFIDWELLHLLINGNEKSKCILLQAP